MVVPWLWDEMGSPLDEHQQELAVQDGYHLLINAGPGSGKTRVLVAHYLHLLMTHTNWDVEAVVAITFTEKAAAEMKERIVRVLQRVRQESPEEGWRRRAAELLELLPEAPIGTIHSFCARLLRRFALTAHLDPSFRILDEIEAQTLRREICERWLWEQLTNRRSDYSSDAGTIVTYWDFPRAVRLLTEMLTARLTIEYRQARNEPIFCQLGELSEPEQALEHCYHAVAIAYDQAKAERNCLDYDDLLLRTWKLLRDEETVRQQLRQLYRRILVDELQDTDRIQVDILRLLCGWDEPNPTGVFFFGVGDSQQSIYGFRNADVSVFNQLWAEAGIRLGWRRERLDKNYRSVPSIVALANCAFERIFRVSESATAIEQKVRMPLQPMTAVRNEEDEVPVELAFFKVSEGLGKWQRLRVEAEWIAQRIRELHERGINYRDIAVLLRELVNATVYEEALRRYGIPYHIIASYGFFATPEARDLFSFLQVLAEPDNEIALASWLRSPMVGVNDETLFWLFQCGGKDWWESGEGEPPINEETEREKLQWARQLLAKAREKMERESVRELLEWLLRETRYDALVAALLPGRQRLANIRKFIRLAHQLSEELRLNVRGLTRYARALVEGEVRIGEPPLAGATADAVQVMTIHAAKGLEFPVVIVPMLGEVSAPQSSRDDFVTDPDKGIAVRLMDEAGHSLPRNDQKMARFKAVDEVRILRERAESERLLFVAWTRAKDRLILVGCVDENKKGKGNSDGGWDNWLQLVSSVLQVPVGETRDEPIEIADGVRVWLRGETVTADSLQRRWAVMAEAVGEQWLQKPETIPAAERLNLDLPRLPAPVLTLSVTALEEMVTLKERPDAPTPLTVLPAREAGLIVHALLRYRATEPTDEQIRWVATMVGADPDAAQADAEVVRQFVRRAVQSTAWQRACETHRRWHELDFRVRLVGEPPVELVGRWDLLAQPEGWLVVDFKTDAVKSPEDAQQLFAQCYLVQAKAYALAVHRVFGAEQVETVFVFVNSDQVCEVRHLFCSTDWVAITEELRTLAQKSVKENKAG